MAVLLAARELRRLAGSRDHQHPPPARRRGRAAPGAAPQPGLAQAHAPRRQDVRGHRRAGLPR